MTKAEKADVAMTGAGAVALDWLAELDVAIAEGDEDKFGEIAREIAKAAPGLKPEVLKRAERFKDEDWGPEVWREWAEGFFKTSESQPRVEVQPKAREKPFKLKKFSGPDAEGAPTRPVIPKMKFIRTGEAKPEPVPEEPEAE